MKWLFVVALALGLLALGWAHGFSQTTCTSSGVQMTCTRDNTTWVQDRP